MVAIALSGLPKFSFSATTSSVLGSNFCNTGLSRQPGLSLRAWVSRCLKPSEPHLPFLVGQDVSWPLGEERRPIAVNFSSTFRAAARCWVVWGSTFPCGLLLFLPAYSPLISEQGASKLSSALELREHLSQHSWVWLHSVKGKAKGLGGHPPTAAHLATVIHPS